METTLLKKIMQQATKVVCFSILALAMASCDSGKEAEEAKEAADKAKEEAQKAKEEAEKIKKDLEAKITRLEATSAPGELAAMKDKLDPTKGTYILKDVYTKKEIDDKEAAAEKTVADAINEIKVKIADVYTKQEADDAIAVEVADVYKKQEVIDKINELNKKIFSMNWKGFNDDPIKQ
jgi:hypothetical protein